MLNLPPTWPAVPAQGTPFGAGGEAIAVALLSPVDSYAGAVHDSGLFDAARRHPAAHAAEHGSLLGAVRLFRRPVMGREPSP